MGPGTAKVGNVTTAPGAVPPAIQHFLLHLDRVGEVAGRLGSDGPSVWEQPLLSWGDAQGAKWAGEDGRIYLM